MPARAGDVVQRTAAGAPVPIGILGDSDSHSYQDELLSTTRFGRFRPVTFQWPEALARLRPTQLDLGAWGERGTRRSVAELMDWVGLGGRFPRKQDYLHNLAFAGATCGSLMGYDGRLARRMAATMDRDPGKWRLGGVVIIALGVNDFGHANSLDLLVENPAAPQVQAKIAGCLEQIRQAVALIRTSYPATRFVLVGILGDVDDPSNLTHWRSANAIRNINIGFDAFDNGLKAMAAADPRIAFAPLRPWFAQHWGSRDEQGQPNYKSVTIGDFVVSHSAGDDPKNCATADEHSGVAWNALWAQSLVALMNARFDLGIAPISDAEVAEFLRPAIEASRRTDSGG
ncbi:MAG TPA: SGNH/GDSL hydrolase family protein [Burkholderiaceae bacterium]|nr:SGNH/GDSL hydrolase family protein [Burkholderiaceae bacterium]